MGDPTIKSGTPPATGEATDVVHNVAPTTTVQADTKAEATPKQEADGGNTSHATNTITHADPTTTAPNAWPTGWTAVNVVHQTNAGVSIKASERKGTPSTDAAADGVSATAESIVNEIDGASADNSVNVPVLADTVAPDASSPNNNNNTTAAVPSAPAIRALNSDSANISTDDDPNFHRNGGEKWTQFQKFWLYRLRQDEPPLQYEGIGRLFGKTALACRICMHHLKKDVDKFGADEVFSEDFPKRRARLAAEDRARQRQGPVSQGSRPSNPRPRGQSSRVKATESRDDANNSPPASEESSAPCRRAKSDPTQQVSAVNRPVSQLPLPSVGSSKLAAWGDKTEGRLIALWREPDGLRMSEQESMPALGFPSPTAVAEDESETEEAQASRPPTRKGPARNNRASKYQASKAEASTARVRKPEPKRSRGKAAAPTTTQVSPEAPKFSGKKYPEPAPKFAPGVNYVRDQMSVLMQPRDEDYYTDPYVTGAEDAQGSQVETKYARSAETVTTDPAVLEVAAYLAGVPAPQTLARRSATEVPPVESTSQALQRSRYKKFPGLTKAQTVALERATQADERRKDRRIPGPTRAQNLALEETTQVSESRPATDTSKWLTQVPVRDSTPLLSERMSDYAAENLGRNTGSQAAEPRRSDTDISDRMSVSNFLSKD